MMGDFSAALFWVTEYGIWPSSENMHLYYRLRSSYGNSTELRTEPGHLALAYEQSDLVSFLDLAIQFGWGGHVIPSGSLAYVFISHDGWMHVEPWEESDQLKRGIEELGLEIVRA